MYTNRMPALTKICAAMATDTLVGSQAHTLRKVQVRTRAIEKPMSNAEMKNKWPFFRFVWKMMMFDTADER